MQQQGRHRPLLTGDVSPGCKPSQRSSHSALQPWAIAVTVQSPRPGFCPSHPPPLPAAWCSGEWVKGYAVRAAGPSETTHPPPTPGRDHPLAQPQQPENSRIQPLVLGATRWHSDPPFGKAPPRGRVGGLCHPVWNWVSRQLPRGGGLWGSRGCPVRTPLLLLRGSVSLGLQSLLQITLPVPGELVPRAALSPLGRP